MLVAALLLALPQNPEPPDFVRDVQPILRRACWECHGIEKQKGDIRLDLRKHVFGEDKDLWTIVPGEPDESLFFELLVLEEDNPDRMPKKQAPLPKEDIEILRRWIAAGAEWPESADAAVLAAEAAQKRTTIVLDDAARTRRDASLEALRSHRVAATRIAADTDAVDVNFALRGAAIDDAAVAGLRGLEPCLERLSLARTKVSDAGLAVVADMKLLRRLDLSQTGVTDAGLGKLAGLSELRYLNLFGTKVTDAGLARLAELPMLEKVFVWQTAVTEDGVATLREAAPKLVVDVGGHASSIAAVRARIEAQKAADAEKPAPPKCPITGKPADPKIVAKGKDGKDVAFCCEKCKAKFVAQQKGDQKK